MKCCGKERDTPFCPLCGQVLGKTAPLAELLRYLQKQTKASEKKMISSQQQIGPQAWGRENQEMIKTAKKDQESFQRWKKWTEALSGSLSQAHEPAKVFADWLEENGEASAGAKLRGAFE